MFFSFYVIGGVIGILINLRFLLPAGFSDIKNALGGFDIAKTIVYHLIRTIFLSCFVFFLSWVSIGYFIIHYGDFKSELERMIL